MNLSFKEWFIEEKHELPKPPKPSKVPKRKLPVHANMKQWVSSVENLEKELETLKSILKDKKIDVKDDKHKDVETLKSILKAKKIDVKDDKHKDVAKKLDVIDKKLDLTKDKKQKDKHELPGENKASKVNPYYLIKNKENDKQSTKIEKKQNVVKEKKLNGNVRKLS